MADSTPTVSTEVAADREPVATDEIGGKHHQKVKVEFGVTDSATQVSPDDPLPVGDDAAAAALAALLTELGQKLEPGGQVALDAPSLAALETTTVANPTADPETGLAKDATLMSRLPLDNGSLDVADSYTAGEALASQVGSGGVLTFTFAAPVDLVWVRSVGEVSYADPFGGTPADGTGIYLADDEPAPITVRTSSVKVWAPSGATIYCWGYGG